jgi:hypothetical protein
MIVHYIRREHIKAVIIERRFGISEAENPWDRIFALYKRLKFERES